MAIFVMINSSVAQTVSLSGKVINPDEKPISNVLIYLANNPALHCQSDSLGNFNLNDQINTSVTDVSQDEIISYKDSKLVLYANNQSVSIDIITIEGRIILNLINLNKSLGTIELYPEAYISDLPKAIYIVRVRVGNNLQSYKIQNINPSSFPRGIFKNDINTIIDNSFKETRSITKSAVIDTLILVHDFYKSRKIPLDSYSHHYDSIRLNNFADYSIAEDFEPSVTYLSNGYANFTDVFSADSVEFIIDYDTLSIFNDNLKIIGIPIDKIESLDNSIQFISGLHLEPAGIQFIQPVQVAVIMKDSISDNLVVFCHNDKGETYYIPYVSHVLISGGYCIIFNINHFSDIGIGTGEIPTTNPAEFTTSDQFSSYLAECVSNDKEVTEQFFETWYNKIVVPMINNIRTFDDFLSAFNAFLYMWRVNDFLGFDEFSFYDQAMGLFSDKMQKLWNQLIEAYDINDNCLKREILNDALKIVKLSDLFDDLYYADINDFGDGEFYNLATKIEFAKQIKHLEIGESYMVEYTLICLSGNPLPEEITWSSSKSSVATINSEGKIIALSEGVTIIKGKLCDKEYTFKLEVKGFNCEENYCNSIYQPDHPCFDGIYKGTGILEYYTFGPYDSDCQWYYVTDRITIISYIGSGACYFKSIWSSEQSRPDYLSGGEKCYMEYDLIPNLWFIYDYYLKPWRFVDCSCEGVNNFSIYLGDTQGGYYDLSGRLEGNSLVFDVIRYISWPKYITKYTQIYCTRIDE